MGEKKKVQAADTDMRGFGAGTQMLYKLSWICALCKLQSGKAAKRMSGKGGGLVGVSVEQSQAQAQGMTMMKMTQ